MLLRPMIGLNVCYTEMPVDAGAKVLFLPQSKNKTYATKSLMKPKQRALHKHDGHLHTKDLPVSGEVSSGENMHCGNASAQPPTTSLHTPHR